MEEKVGVGNLSLRHYSFIPFQSQALSPRIMDWGRSVSVERKCQAPSRSFTDGDLLYLGPIVYLRHTYIDIGILQEREAGG